MFIIRKLKSLKRLVFSRRCLAILLFIIACKILYTKHSDMTTTNSSRESKPKEVLNIDALKRIQTQTIGVVSLGATAGLQLLPVRKYNANRSDTTLQRLLNCNDQELKTAQVPFSSDWLLLQNIVRGAFSRHVGCADTITVTTHGDFHFVKYLLPLVERWRAPISMAVFAPGHDIYPAMAAIQDVRNCHAESALIRKYVSFHIYFPRTHIPKYVPADEEDIFTLYFSCSADAAQMYSQKDSDTYKNIHSLTYPINVGRNIARLAVNTHFILSLDVEFLPTPGLVQQFLEFLLRQRTDYFQHGFRERVYPLPIFEVKANTSVPKDKHQLMQMLKTGQAVNFDEKLCPDCPRIPEQDNWEKANNTELNVSIVALRENHTKWEPFYISNNLEPLFDERFSLEAQYDKRIQALAMCLLDYEYHILNPAFLVHLPGIKSLRVRPIKHISKFRFNQIFQEYRILFGNNRLCKI